VQLDKNNIFYRYFN